MSRTKRIWCLFAACVAAVTAALAWVTLASLRLERREIEARADTQRQESVRLALWRMDSLLAPLVAQEAARPYAQYSDMLSSNPLSNRWTNAALPAEPSAPAPPVGYPSDLFRLYFQIGPDDVVTSPEVPDSSLGRIATSGPAAGHSFAAARHALARLRAVLKRETLLEALERTAQAGTGEVIVARRPAIPGLSPADRTAQEFTARQKMANLAQNAIQSESPSLGRDNDMTVRQGPIVPIWCAGLGNGPELLFVRSVTAGPLQTVQGIWADWPRLKQWLLGAVQDVLPDADLHPALTDESFPPSRLLASLPAVLDLPPTAGSGFDSSLRLTPTRLTLLAAWAAIAAAVTAVGLVFRAVIALGERRLQFASAITHELRTPLTTFRMYSEMLANGMVRDEQHRQDYLAILSREAERLSGLVENVLLYARIEQNRATTRAESLTVGELLERVRPRLARRAQEAQMELVMDDGGVGDATLSVDCQAVEQILFNLVDNSCKYAGSAADRRLHLDVRTTPGTVEMLYRDHGPGIPPAEERRVFEAFRRANRDAHSATPGIGLGLALARGLARELNGDLKLLRLKDAGAAFSLTLPM